MTVTEKKMIIRTTRILNIKTKDTDFKPLTIYQGGRSSSPWPLLCNHGQQETQDFTLKGLSSSTSGIFVYGVLGTHIIKLVKLFQLKP